MEHICKLCYCTCEKVYKVDVIDNTGRQYTIFVCEDCFNEWGYNQNYN